MNAFSRLGTWVLLGLMVMAHSLCSAAEVPSEEDQIRAIERSRLRALVEAKVDVARELHAEEFQLINPRGQARTRDQYLGDIASGALDYLVWEPESPIAVRLIGQVAVIRYQSRIELVRDGVKAPLRRFWHTDTYDKRSGRWQVVWSQATEIQPPVAATIR